MLSPEAFYSACNLTGNPFRSNPTHASDPRINIWVGYEKQQQQLLKFLTRTRADQVGNANFVMLYGGYGTGKSHALLWAQNYVLNREEDDFDAVCYFVPTLKKAKGQLTFAGAFQDDIVAKSRLIADIQAYRTFLGGCINQYRIENKVSHDVRDESIVEKLIGSVDLSNFAREILSCGDSEEKIRKLVSPSSLSDYQAVVTFTRLVNLFVHEIIIGQHKNRFKKAAYLFIDELDDLLRTTTKEARLVNDNLRHIYDSCPNSFCVVIALSAEVAEFTTIFEDYILSRIQKRVELHLLDKTDASIFINAIMDNSRVDPSGPKGAFPFEPQAVDAIVSQLVEITPRKVVNMMQQVIEEVRLSGFDPTKGPISLNDLDNADVLSEVLGEGGIA
ncbi:hypothetical protein G7077_05120 [Sphingomonas piscis]|uniref:ATP-binding protein n=1 Tax=Sphingomonas piscis TaxID=2714943 RepID=A0A6G7YNR4_9SPHN|nr:hypothetical protein [Sphingomonas piscis]QIK78379.1 hypothetical protein G7077_05120 [Sphingomonas piscis]